VQSLTFIQRLNGIVRLFRPELPCAAGICVLIGEVVVLGALPPFQVFVPGFLCGFLLSASALITNDYFDIEVDRINAPQRPLPAGIVHPSIAMILGLTAGGIGLGVALLIGPAAFALSSLLWLSGFAYNWKLKAMGLWGNLIVCTSVAATFMLGGIAAGQVWNLTLWVFALIVFFFDLAEEIAGDAMDAEGDKERGSKSIAILWGRQVALRLSGILFGVVIVLSVILVFSGGATISYRLVIPLMDIAILYFLSRLVTSRTSEEGRSAMRNLYLTGSMGLLAFLISLLLT
jgi:geranylgeranylglycerol-phosphate geranylgeranyltransferase